MTLVRWRPGRDLMRVRDEFDRLFDEFFGGVMQGSDVASEGVYNPRVDVAESKDEYMISAELPGVEKDKVKISVHNNSLVLTGEKQQEKEEKTESYHRIERSFGTFQRTIGLPSSVNADKIKAHFKDGVLKINLPKTEEAKLREIPISVE